MQNLTPGYLLREKKNILSSYRDRLYFQDVSRVLSSSRYPLFKSLNFSQYPADYLLAKLPIKFQRSFAQLRAAGLERITLTFKSFAYRINQTEICSICNIRRLETTEHVIFECPIYYAIRSTFESSLTFEPNLTNFLNSTWPSFIKKISLLHF